MSGLPKSSLIGMAARDRKDAKKKSYAKGMAEGMKQGEMNAAQMIAKRKDEAARRARGVM